MELEQQNKKMLNDSLLLESTKIQFENENDNLKKAIECANRRNEKKRAI